MASQRGTEDGSVARADTMTSETNIHYPTDYEQVDPAEPFIHTAPTVSSTFPLRSQRGKKCLTRSWNSRPPIGKLSCLSEETLVIKIFATVLILPALVLSFSAQAEDPQFPHGFSARSIRALARKGVVEARSLSSVCKSVAPIRALLKNAYPGHISLSDSRASGFALVCSRSDCPRKFPAKAYFSDGTLAFSLGYYGRWEGNGQPRAYCGTGGAGKCFVKAVSNNARSGKRDGNVYIDFGNGSCRRAAPGKRNGSPF
jgi:hypothetical protein